MVGRQNKPVNFVAKHLKTQLTGLTRQVFMSKNGPQVYLTRLRGRES